MTVELDGDAPNASSSDSDLSSQDMNDTSYDSEEILMSEDSDAEEGDQN